MPRKDMKATEWPIGTECTIVMTHWMVTSMFRQLFDKSASGLASWLSACDLNVIYRLAGKGALERLDVLYHSANRFSTNAPYRTHHCNLYSSVNWTSLYTCRKTHWLMLTYKTLLDLTPHYLRYLLQPSSYTYNTHSASHILLKVPKAHTHSWVTPLVSSLQLATGTSCNKHSNWTVLSQSLHSKTQSWTLYH